MGIQYLNSYIKKNVGHDSLVKVSLKMLENKVIAVDISIYLYRYLSEGDLFENIYHEPHNDIEKDLIFEEITDFINK